MTPTARLAAALALAGLACAPGPPVERDAAPAPRADYPPYLRRLASRVARTDEGIAQVDRVEVATAVKVGEDARGRQLFLTCAHAVPAGAEDVRLGVPASGERPLEEWPAHVVARDESADLALLTSRVPTEGRVRLALDPAGSAAGETVTLWGFRAGADPGAEFAQRLDGPLESAGDELVIRAPVHRGFSGGPVLDATGACIGLLYEAERAGEDGLDTAYALPALRMHDWLTEQGVLSP